MGRVLRRLDGRVVMLGATALAAWLALAVGGSGDGTLTAICSAATAWAASPPVSFDPALMLNSPARLVAGWALMVTAMMSPLIIAPLRHVYDRSFARRRGRAAALFLTGYGTAWMIAGLGLQALVLAVRWVAPAPLAVLGLAAGVALLWQISPAKQWCLNRCHRRPHLAAFGAVADRDVFGFGLTNGAFCAGACWALMLLPLLAERGHFTAMIAVALFLFAERLERPAPLLWRWRGPGKALRIAIAQTRLHMTSGSGIGEVSR
jgi:predicted metal-binding membrane protein